MQKFYLVVGAVDPNGKLIKTVRQVYGDQEELNEMGAMLLSLAILEGLKSFRVVGVYTEIPGDLPLPSLH